MKAIFFGLGSIGSRHARLLNEIGGHELIAFRSGKNGRGNRLKIDEVSGWSEVDRSGPDVAFITNPTHLHVETALQCAKRGMALFIEKPIDASIRHLNDLLSIVESKKIPTYVAYVLRFHPAVQNLKERLVGRTIRKARFVCRSYFPNWRLGQNHLKSYAAQRETGGGALLELSHEFDLVSHLMGSVEKISGSLQKRANVTFDAEDYVEADVETQTAKAEILIDIASPESERKIAIETDSGELTADLMQNQDRDLPYREQLRYFMSQAENPRMMNNLFEAAPLFEKMIQFREKNFFRQEKYHDAG